MAVTLEDVVAYLGGDVASAFGDDEMANALAAETELQGKAVKYPTDTDGNPVASPALDEALKRRVQVNLARRGLAYGMVLGDGQLPARIGVDDGEIRRLERNYRRRGVG